MCRPTDFVLDERVCLRYYENTIHVIDVSSDSGGSSWLVDDRPTGLSTNSARNVLVTCCNADKIQDYMTCRLLVREVRLHQQEVAEPVHVIQLNEPLGGKFSRFVAEPRSPRRPGDLRFHPSVEVDVRRLPVQTGSRPRPRPV